jgi:hypothetical protein
MRFENPKVDVERPVFGIADEVDRMFDCGGGVVARAQRVSGVAFLSR